MALINVITNDNSSGIDARYRRITTKGIEQTTRPNEEIIEIPDGKSVALYKRVTVFVETACTIIRNHTERIYVFDKGEFRFDEESTPTTSIVIVEQGTRYYGVADY